ncbi:MAG: hypothetical protein GYA17_11825 [Chloroflexi bacterium]|nr:hypothetical protein [Anaerolineaceae bacterium]NMB89040.1 hypothetical protein [Chloroflexota bacterium]
MTTQKQEPLLVRLKSKWIARFRSVLCKVTQVLNTDPDCEETFEETALPVGLPAREVKPTIPAHRKRVSLKMNKNNEISELYASYVDVHAVRMVEKGADQGTKQH